MVAPRIPLAITSTAVSEGKPPTRSATAIATGAVTPLGAMEAISSRGAPQSFSTAMASSAPIRLPASRVTNAGVKVALTSAH